MFITLFIALVTYSSMVFFTMYRTPIAVLGSGILLLYGTISNAFPASLAFQTFPTEIVILVIVLALFSRIFENNGFFDYIGAKFIKVSKGNKIIISVLIPLIICLISLFMNNLSAVLLFTFISLELAVKLRLPAAPILASVIIGSNIGGTPLPWADTPAVVLTLYSDFNLFDFITKLLGPCALYTFLLVLYTVWWCKHENKKPGPENNQSDSKDRDEVPAIAEPLQHLGPMHPHPFPHEGHIPPHVGKKPSPPKFDGVEYLCWSKKKFSKVNSELMGGYRENKKANSHFYQNRNPNWISIQLPVIMFALLILLICIAPFLNISIAYVSMIFIGLGLLLINIDPEQFLNSLPIMDSLVFISALFLIAGVLEYSGVLKTIVDYIMTYTSSNRYLITLFIMLGAFVIATFLSAGPAAATLLPVCQQLSPVVGNRIVFAALAFGILAGSSMLPWSATGGPVMFSEVNRFLRERNLEEVEKTQIIKVFNLKYYLAFSIPFSLIILILSGAFLCLYLIVQ